MNTPVFSVIIPTYNRAYVLAEAVNSVINQTFRDFELIIVDDNSDDDTYEVLKNITDKRVKLYRNERTKGPSGARNVGIYRANAEWIVFLDSDDIWKPEMLESVYRAVSRCDNNIGLIHTGYALSDKSCRNIKPIDKRNRRGNLFNNLIYKNCIGTFSCVAVRTQIARRIGGLDENIIGIEDWDFYLRVSRIANIEVIPEILLYYRNNFGDNLTLDNEKILSNIVLFRRKFQDEIDSHPTAKYKLANQICLYAFKTYRWRLFFKYLPATVGAFGKGVW